MSKRLALLLASVFAGPLPWYNFRDFFADVDRRRAAPPEDDAEPHQPGFVEQRLDFWFGVIAFTWRIIVPLTVFGVTCATLSSVSW